jgi:hypothetical protein
MPAQPDDPNQIADYLVQEHGVAGAQALALENTLKAQAEQQLYKLSIWRDVRRILRSKAKPKL